tara:strand:- start:454 stop:564 length:111 start_codon:yes stop_codon:yes gene_type:complete
MRKMRGGGSMMMKKPVMAKKGKAMRKMRGGGSVKKK